MAFRKIARAAGLAALALVCVIDAGDVRAQQQPSAAAVATAKQLIQIKGSTTYFDPLVPGVIEQAKNMFAQQSPNLIKELNDVAAQLRTELAPRHDELNEQFARLYAQHFTEQELKDILAFYSSPVGKKLTAEEPAFVEQSLRYAQDWANKLSDDVIAKMRAAMKKKGHDL